MGFSKLNGLPSLRDVRYSCPESFNTVPDQISNLPDNRDNGQHYLRGVRCVVKYTNVCQCHLGTVHLRFSTLEVARKVRGEACGDLQADPVSLQKDVAGDQVFQL